MSRLPWGRGSKVCPKCGELQSGRPGRWSSNVHLAFARWRCPGCNALLGFDAWRWAGILLDVAFVCLMLLMIWVLDAGICLMGIFLVFGLGVLWLPWRVSVVLKEEKVEKS
jgi:hypothetical protein